MGKGENASDQHFLLFPPCFLPISTRIFVFKLHFFCHLKLFSIWISLNFFRSVKSYTFRQIIHSHKTDLENENHWKHFLLFPTIISKRFFLRTVWSKTRGNKIPWQFPAKIWKFPDTLHCNIWPFHHDSWYLEEVQNIQLWFKRRCWPPSNPQPTLTTFIVLLNIFIVLLSFSLFFVVLLWYLEEVQNIQLWFKRRCWPPSNLQPTLTTFNFPLNIFIVLLSFSLFFVVLFEEHCIWCMILIIQTRGAWAPESLHWIDQMVFYTTFNSISVISRPQLTLFMSFLGFTSTRLGS